MGKKKSDARRLREKEQRKIKRQKQLEKAMKNPHYRVIEKGKNYINSFMNRCRIMIDKKVLQICGPCFRDCIVVPVEGNMLAHCENHLCGIQLCKKCYKSKLCGFCQQDVALRACAKGHAWDSMYLPCANHDENSERRLTYNRPIPAKE